MGSGGRFRCGCWVDSGAVLTCEGSGNTDVLVNMEREGMCVLTGRLRSRPAGEEGGG